MPDPYAASRQAGERIEALYARPLTELAADAAPGSMRYALLDSFDALQYAERAVAFHTEQLHRLTGPERAMGSVEVGHIADAARRLAHAVAVRDSHAQVLGGVLQSLHRTPGTTTPVPGPMPSAAPARSR
ncbi:hypothetical protein ACFH04_13455 [Streptomyces noboritoensis]|uniref:Uncharacterized protein n=1 Tax=Streptomyces noboritoensis TaxID=67337 RepID=A0ABV6TFY8_9ACTN